MLRQSIFPRTPPKSAANGIPARIDVGKVTERPEWLAELAGVWFVMCLGRYRAENADSVHVFLTHYSHLGCGTTQAANMMLSTN